MNLPAYPETGFGRNTGPRKPRPLVDSLPSHECDEKGCGTVGPVLFGPDEDRETAVMVSGYPDGPDLWFCSWGCVSRFAIRQELRQ